MADPYSDVANELRSVKMLLILQLLRSGVRQSQIAAMLSVSDATMSRMLPKGISKSISRKVVNEDEA